MRKQLRILRGRSRFAPILATALALSAVIPQNASAGILDFLFGGGEPTRAPAQQQSTFDPFGLSTPAQAPAPAAAPSGRFTMYCVRSCDGRYFPLTARGGNTPAQMCQSFCPASPTKVYSGNSIESATAPNGERYPESANAFAYRKTLKADCTCNGRDPTGLAPVDLTLDPTLRPGDVVATANGLVAYSGTKNANGQTAEFTPVANYPGLTADVRARLGEMKVAPVSAEISEDTYSSQDITGALAEPKPIQSRPIAPKATGKNKRAELN